MNRVEARQLVKRELSNGFTAIDASLIAALIAGKVITLAQFKRMLHTELRHKLEAIIEHKEWADKHPYIVD